tara:strand:- start:11535 stop:14900 length:3366 start_codon:yes stop_codon:yes gene_type:complete
MAKYYSQTSPAWNGVQVGTISMMPKDATGAYYAPAGWLECNGRSLDPNEYLGLYTIIQATYGGTVTGTFPAMTGSFNVPDLRDRRVVGTGRLRPDGASPQLEQHDSGTTNNTGTTGGKNNITLLDVASRVQLVSGSVQSTFNTSRLQQVSTQITDGVLEVNSGFLANHTMPHWPPHSHGTGYTSMTSGGGITADRTSPGSGDTQIQGGPSGGTTYDGSQILVTGGASEPHSHWVSFKGSIGGTVSYHKGWGDSVGIRGQNTAGNGYAGNDWYQDFCVSGSGGSGSSSTSWVTTYGPAYTTQNYVSFYQNVFTYVYQGSTVGTITMGTGQSEPVESGGKRYYGGSLAVDNGNSWQNPNYYEIQVKEEQTSGSGGGSADPANEGLIDINNGSCTIKPTASMMQWVFDMSPVDATQVTFQLDVDLGLEGTPDLQPEYQETAYMIFAGVSSDAYTPPPGGGAGDQTPDQVGPFNIAVTQASGDGLVSFNLTGVSNTYSFDVEVLKTGGESVSSQPINVGGTGLATKTGYVLDDTISMTLEAPASGGTNAQYEIRVKFNASTVMTAQATITYEAAPTITISALPTSVSSGTAANVTFESAGATAVVSSNFGATTATGQTLAVYPTVTTTYTVTLSNAWGSTTGTTVVNVQAANAPTINMSVNPTQITAGGSSAVSYNCNDADTFISATSSPTDTNWDNASHTTTFFSQSVSPTATTIYYITLENQHGQSTQQVTLTVDPLPLPEVSLSSNITTTEYGNYDPDDDTEAIMTWSTINTAGVTISGTSTPNDPNWNPTTTSGVFNVAPQVNTTYTITATNSSGSDSANVAITVISMPEITLTVNRSYTPAVGSSQFIMTSGASADALDWLYFCCNEPITVGYAVTGTANTIWGGIYWGTYTDSGTNPSNDGVNTNLGSTGNNATGTWSSVVPMPSENGNSLGGVDAISASKRKGIIKVEASNTAGMVAISGYRFVALQFRIARYSDWQNTAYFTGSNFGVGNSPQTTYNFSTVGVSNQGYIDVFPALINAGTTWTCTSILNIIGAGGASNSGELKARVINGKFLVEDLPSGQTDDDFIDLTAHCNVADFSGPSTGHNTAATATFSITMPGGDLNTSDINDVWEPGDGDP